MRASGCGAVGSALPWGGRGRWFKSSHSDQIKPNGFIHSVLFFVLVVGASQLEVRDIYQIIVPLLLLCKLCDTMREKI